MSRRHGPRNKTVGYGKPPSHSRFRKGQSGNPRGRPKKNKDDAIDVVGILDEPITATKNGKTKKISPFDAAMIALVKKALKENNLGAALDFIRRCEEVGIMAPEIGRLPKMVYIIPRDITSEEYRRMWDEHGPPPWPGERSGLPWWEEEELERGNK
jgi:hypothetical protein